jgi:hypothetical protein
MKWSGLTAVVLASGPSLTTEQCETVAKWHAAGYGKAVAINTTYERALFADALYACDHVWWAYHIKDVKRKFKGELWTQDRRSAEAYKLNHIPSRRSEKQGISRDPAWVNQGQTSTIQAINLLYHWGVKKYILLGCDAGVSPEGKTHWHESHVQKVDSPYGDWVRNFDRVAEDLGKDGVEIVNSTPDSRLHLPYVPLREALNARSLFTS